MQKYLASEEETEAFGAELVRQLPSKGLVFLCGNLGAGKTTLVRGYLKAAGYAGTVKSPTYNIVEEYSLPGRQIYHFDLYRLTDSEELEWLGIYDYLAKDALSFVEWPEHGRDILPAPDFIINLTQRDHGRVAEIRRS